MKYPLYDFHVHTTFCDGKCTPEELVLELGRCSCARGGARHLRRLVQERVEGPLAIHLLKCGKKPSRIRACLAEGMLQFQNLP